MTKTKNARRNYRRIGLFGLGLFVTVFLFAFLAQGFGKLQDDTSAANLANFQAGYIISDYQMTDYNSMSEADIQDFLWSKGKCYNTNFRDVGTQSDKFSDSTPPTTWHVKDGHTVCLAEENMNGESAAHIIWQAAQDYRINPKVLIVLLQKETGLITDPIPNSWDYQRAAGYGCPDTAACSEKYYGFKNQIRNAASLFRIVMDGNSSYYPIGNNTVRYSPDPACGSSTVYIQNLATSALYRYTPYQPNAGALAAGYGTAPCGAYGNRNFYAYFEDWFGNITWDGWPSLSTVLSKNRVASEGTDLAVQYQAHVSHYGWLGWVNGGEMAGTAGYSLQVESFMMKLANGQSGVSYQAYVDGTGWQDYVSDGAIAGTVGKGLKMEALKIKLSEALAKKYDVHYRAHVAGVGWMEWVKNDEVAGVAGQNRWIEALQVKIVLKESEDLNVQYSVHAAGVGWMEWVKNGELGGTTGQARQLEALKVEIKNDAGELMEGVSYQAHVAGIGWMDWMKDGAVGGTTGQARQLEAIKIKLSETLAEKYDIYYRAHVANIGWMDWMKNGELAGTTGRSLQMEALEIKLVEK